MKTILQIARILLIPPLTLLVVWLCVFSPLIIARLLSDTVFVNITQGGLFVAAENVLTLMSWVFVTVLFSVPSVVFTARWEYKMFPSNMHLGLKHLWATFVNYVLIVLGLLGVVIGWAFVEGSQLFLGFVVVTVNFSMVIANWIVFRRMGRL